MTQFAARDQLNLDEIRAVYRGIMRAARGRWALVDPGALLSMDAGDADTDVDPRVAVGVLEQAGLVLRHPDAPATRSLWVEPGQAQDGADGTWARFLAWAGLVGGGQATVETAAACDALGLTPTELDRLLGERDPTVRDGRRLVCLELLPAGDDARARLTAVLERAKVEANRRIAQVMAYANGGSCRHAALAAHLGERLPPCRTACDVCRRAAGAEDDPRAGANGRTPVAAPAARSTIGPEDALAVLEAVRTLPFPMGKTGLGKLLVGSVESRVRADRSSAFGKLAGLTRGKVEGLIDRLAEDGFLFRNLEHEFKVITLTERGAAATAEDLDGYASVLRSPARAGGAERLAAGEDLELDPDGELLLHRLTEWRTATASAEAMPPYVIAHNRTLLALALHRPTTPEELGRIDGFGPKRVEKYGPELLALIAAG